MSYLEHFGLTEEPFSNAPVSRFYFESPQHQQALVRLTHAVSRMRGLSVLVGVARAPILPVGIVPVSLPSRTPALHVGPKPGHKHVPDERQTAFAVRRKVRFNLVVRGDRIHLIGALISDHLRQARGKSLDEIIVRRPVPSGSHHI